jgi:hypothetical protein
MTMERDLELHREAEVMTGYADQARAQSRFVDAVRFDRQAETYLKPGNLPDFARLDLEEMIEEMRAEIEAGAAVERLPS